MTDRDSRPWWDALARGELLLQRCDECDAWRWPPRAACNRCGSFSTRWERVSGRGRVASWIVNRHTFGGAVPSPSVVLMVRLDEQDDLVLPGTSAGDAEGRDLALDLPVQVELVPGAPDGDGDAVTLLRWSAVGG
ncbi:MAG TPA: zinc ribbon domain-containing protein [Acidimicrobiia bacterium]|jgi:hypothetical protein